MLLENDPVGPPGRKKGFNKSDKKMNQTRRTFLKTGALALTVTAMGSSKLFARAARKEILGIQLYTVRQDMVKDPLGTLRQLAGAGYHYVEHANYIDRKFYGYTAADFKKQLDEMGLKMCSGHVQFGMEVWDPVSKAFTDKWKYTMEDALTAGQTYLINPWMDERLREDYEGLLRFIELLNQCGAACKQEGLKFGYHNHDFEFSTSFHQKKVYDILLEKTDPSLVAQQLDMGNMYGGGGRPLDYLKRYPGRFELIHVKDVIKNPDEQQNGGYENTILGKGVIPVKQVVDLARQKGGTTCFIIEQESYQGKMSVACAHEDLDVMKKWNF